MGVEPFSAQSAMAFFAASLVLAATPGPGVLFIVTRTLAAGRRQGLVSVAGVAAGNLGNALGAALGLAAVLALWPPLFELLKLAGASYLAWLGWQALRVVPPAVDGAASAPGVEADLGRVFREGALVALLNPKTALFFAAFLPQFAPASGHGLLLSSALHGAAFVAIAACTDSAYVLAAGTVRRAVGQGTRLAAIGRCACALVYFGLALTTLFAARPAAS